VMRGEGTGGYEIRALENAGVRESKEGGGEDGTEATRCDTSEREEKGEEWFQVRLGEERK